MYGPTAGVPCNRRRALHRQAINAIAWAMPCPDAMSMPRPVAADGNSDTDDDVVASALVSCTVIRNGTPRLDQLAEEIPVAFEYNGISHAVMLATPTDLEDFVVGFSLSEGIVESSGQIFDIRIEKSTSGLVAMIEIAGGPFVRLKNHRRTLAGRTGCGLCGTESLDQVVRAVRPLQYGEPFSVEALKVGLRSLPGWQHLQRASGATHAACRVNGNGGISHVREDVGRHNALDKTLGALSREAVPAAGGALLITSRASFEMVQKAAMLGYGTLAAVSAPTGAAVRLANSLNLGLIGFLREDGHAIYTQQRPD